MGSFRWDVLRELRQKIERGQDLIVPLGARFSAVSILVGKGPAADGNKLALFRLLREGFQVCGFIHDEMLILIPDGIDYTQAVERVEQILTSAMQELCPDIPICTEYLLADRWYKDVSEQPRDEQQGIIPYSKGCRNADADQPLQVQSSRQ